MAEGEDVQKCAVSDWSVLVLDVLLSYSSLDDTYQPFISSAALYPLSRLRP